MSPRGTLWRKHRTSSNKRRSVAAVCTFVFQSVSLDKNELTIGERSHLGVFDGVDIICYYSWDNGIILSQSAHFIAAASPIMNEYHWNRSRRESSTVLLWLQSYILYFQNVHLHLVSPRSTTQSELKGLHQFNWRASWLLGINWPKKNLTCNSSIIVQI